MVATGVCYRYGVDKSRIGVIGSVCIIPGSIDVDGLVMLLVSNGESFYTGCPRRKGPNFGRVFLRSNYTDITQNTYIQSSMVTEILSTEV